MENFIIGLKFIRNGLLSPQSSNSHLVFCQCSCLITADIIGSSHSLAG